MSSINIDVFRLRTVANNLSKTLRTIEEVIVDMAEVEQDIPAAWKSAYTEMYLEKFDDVKKKARDAKIKLGNIQSGLYRTANRTEELEESIRQQLEEGRNK